MICEQSKKTFYNESLICCKVKFFALIRMNNIHIITQSELPSLYPKLDSEKFWHRSDLQWNIPSELISITFESKFSEHEWIVLNWSILYESEESRNRSTNILQKWFFNVEKSEWWHTKGLYQKLSKASVSHKQQSHHWLVYFSFRNSLCFSKNSSEKTINQIKWVSESQSNFLFKVYLFRKQTIT